MNKILLVTANDAFASSFLTQAKYYGGADWIKDVSHSNLDGYQLIITENLSTPHSPRVVYLSFGDLSANHLPTPLIKIVGQLDQNQVSQILSSCFGFGPIKDQVYIGQVSPSPTILSTPPIIPHSSLSEQSHKASEPSVNQKHNMEKPRRLKGRSSSVKSSLSYLISGMTMGAFTLLLGLAIPAGSLGLSSFCARQSLKEAVAFGSINKSLVNCSQSFSKLSLATALPLSGFNFFGNIVDAAKTIDYATKTLDVVFDSGLEGFFANSSKLDIGRVASVLSVYSESIEPLNQRIPGLKGALDLIATFEPLLSHHRDILGFNKPVTYMVLFQNNMELRPTGGFIGSFALVDIASGKLDSWKVYDVYDADGQLPGYVRPPEPIFNHLKEAQWWLRDSNWDPDFPTSARRATWFLDKSLDRQVRGVIAVNLEVLREVLASVGPVELEGGEVIDANNFYSHIQNEVHESFFPGSTKKKDKLTEVANAVMVKLSSLPAETMVKLLGGINNRIDSKDFQMFFPDSDFSAKLFAMGVSGSVREGSVGFVEANLGVNKANQYVDRGVSLKVKKEQGKVVIDKTITIQNSAKEDSGDTVYKSYVRSLAPASAKLVSLKVEDRYGVREPKPDITFVSNRVEFGALVETQAGKQSTLKVSFEIATDSLVEEKGETGLWFFKQSGASYKDFKVEDLTLGGVGSYNSSLTSDIFIKIQK